jgi:hydroxypyruvate reductase
MNRSQQQLREDALAIWRAGVAAVDSERLVREHVRAAGDALYVDDEPIALEKDARVVVVGAGKAGAGMAAGLEAALGEELMSRVELSGWVNVPADCVRTLSRIKLHAARPAHVNEPTADGVFGAEQILKMVSRLTPRDVCICLLSGGGSALLPAPEGVSLEGKLAITRLLSGAGANIEELNTVRKQLSRIKGEGLARACRAGRLVSLIISDVMGDPLDIIASGPTVANESTPQDAIEVLLRYGGRDQPAAAKALEHLEEKSRAPHDARQAGKPDVRNVIIGNNAAAVDAAGVEAEKRGYSHAMISARSSEGLADDVGRHLADMALSMRSQDGPDCLISGGEPVVKLAPSGERGLGGRNQQLALAALERLVAGDASSQPGEGIALLSGGTDGEDGPTDAAGAIIDAQVIAEARRRRQDPAEYLRKNDAYHFFEPLGALIKTGPTHTNVGDLRVITVSRTLTPT